MNAPVLLTINQVSKELGAPLLLTRLAFARYRVEPEGMYLGLHLFRADRCGEFAKLVAAYRESQTATQN